MKLRKRLAAFPLTAIVSVASNAQQAPLTRKQPPPHAPTPSRTSRSGNKATHSIVKDCGAYKDGPRPERSGRSHQQWRRAEVQVPEETS